MTTQIDGDDPRLAELLHRWEELHEQGRSASPEELCSTCPELAEELGRLIARGRRIGPPPGGATTVEEPCGPVVGATTVDERGPVAAVDAPGRHSATARAEFRELRFHAAGALGEVFMARDAELNRDVALKFLRPERLRDPDSSRRFFQEAEVTGRLEHPGVVPIYALGIDDSGSPCYAMRFVRGATLQDAIDAFHAAEKPGRDPSERSLALRDLLNRFVSICNTVAYAHSRGILHRDLKPRNVMLGKYDETLVVDWGLAKPFDRDETARSVGEETLTPSSGSGSDTPTVGAVGTPAYMSPEQAEGRWEEVGPASDLFSLGGILYAILSGRAPFPGTRVGEILEAVKRCEFPAPRELMPRVPRALEAICLKAMARRPTDRYATALELAADVRRWLADEPVTAWREPLSTRVRRWGRRHKLTASVSAACLLTAVFFLWLGRSRAERQAQVVANYEDAAATLVEILEVIAEGAGPGGPRPSRPALRSQGPLASGPVPTKPATRTPEGSPAEGLGGTPAGPGPDAGAALSERSIQRLVSLRDRFKRIKSRLKSRGQDQVAAEIDEIIKRYDSKVRAEADLEGSGTFTPRMIGD